MPLETVHHHERCTWGIWKIDESEAVLNDLLGGEERIPDPVHNPKKRLEHLGARVLLKHLLLKRGLRFHGLRKDAFGKPFFVGIDEHLSLTHSFPYVAAIVHRSANVGIDLEQPKQKLLAIAPRILHATELADAGSDVLKHCIIWCAKESLIKYHGKKDLTFAENLRIKPFSMAAEGILTGSILVDTQQEDVPLYYRVYPNFTLVLTN